MLKSILLLILSALFLTSCFRWAARAVDQLPEETALEKRYEYGGKVIVIGAGASGLAAAKILEQNKVDYTILEATDRYGGRLKKDSTLADFPIDLGAEWIHSHPKVLNVIKGKKGNEIEEELIPYKLESAARWNGKNLKMVSSSYMNFIYNFLPESKFKNSTWYDFVNKNIATEVKDNIVYNAAVNSIDYSGDKVLVRTNGGKTYKADKVLVTVSIGVLKSNQIIFNPALSDEKKKAIESITFHPGFKVALKFTEKFYPDAINCKVSNGEKVYYDIAFKKERKSNILGFLCTGDASQYYYSLSSKESIISSLINELDAMFGGKASKFYAGEYLFEDWGQYEYTLGTWTKAFIEKSSHLKVLREPLRNRVYFSGEIYDKYRQMGVPGAILSGYTSVDEMFSKPE